MNKGEADGWHLHEAGTDGSESGSEPKLMTSSSVPESLYRAESDAVQDDHHRSHLDTSLGGFARPAWLPGADFPVLTQLPGVGSVWRIVQAPVEALATLPEALVALNRSIRAVSRSLEQVRETVVTVQRVATRADQLLTELDEPVRALVPGLNRLGAMLNDPAIEDIPSIVRQLHDTQEKVHRLRR